MANKIYKFILSILTLLFPFGIIFGLGFAFISHVILVLSIAWLINFIIAKETQTKVLSLLIGGFFLASFFLDDMKLSYFYPVIINAFFLFVFANSLKTTPIITKFALLREKNLSEFAKKYTKNLTKIWCVFFIINGLIAFSLIFFEDKSYWAYYNGFLSYILIGAFFMVEFVLRIILKRRYDA